MELGVGARDDLQFARRLATNEHGAIDQLVSQYHRQIYRFLRQLTGHQQVAEDLTQQTLLRVIDRAGQYSGAGSFKSWVYGIAYRQYTHWRRGRLWLPLLVDQPDSADPFSQIDEAEALLAAVRTLPNALQISFLLHYVEDLSIADISIALAIPEGTVKSRLHTARTQLRNQLKDTIHATETL